VAALIGGTSAAQAAKLAEAARASPTAVFTPSGAADADHRLTFPVGLAPSEQGKHLARFAHAERGATAAAVVADAADPRAAALASEFAREFRHADRALREWTYRPDKSDRELPDLARRVADFVKSVKGGPVVLLFAGPPRDLPGIRDELR